jgi:hypothetical protein
MENPSKSFVMMGIDWPMDEGAPGIEVMDIDPGEYLFLVLAPWDEIQNTESPDLKSLLKSGYPFRIFQQPGIGDSANEETLWIRKQIDETGNKSISIAYRDVLTIVIPDSLGYGLIVHKEHPMNFLIGEEHEWTIEEEE